MLQPQHLQYPNYATGAECVRFELSIIGKDTRSISKKQFRLAEEKTLSERGRGHHGAVYSIWPSHFRTRARNGNTCTEYKKTKSLHVDSDCMLCKLCKSLLAQNMTQPCRCVMNAYVSSISLGGTVIFILNPLRR